MSIYFLAVNYYKRMRSTSAYSIKVGGILYCGLRIAYHLHVPAEDIIMYSVAKETTFLSVANVNFAVGTPQANYLDSVTQGLVYIM